MQLLIVLTWPYAVIALALVLANYSNAGGSVPPWETLYDLCKQLCKKIGGTCTNYLCFLTHDVMHDVTYYTTTRHDMIGCRNKILC